jgi:hypothetical protein
MAPAINDTRLPARQQIFTLRVWFIFRCTAPKTALISGHHNN